MEKHFTFQEYEHYTVIEMLIDKFDFFEISESAQHLRELLENIQYPNIIFDLGRVGFIDSSVFGFLIEIRNSIVKHDNEIVIVCLNANVLHIMEMLKVPQLIKIFSSRDKAATYLNEQYK